MQWPSRFFPFRRLLVLSVLLMLTPAVALVWLGWRLLEQDRALEREQLRERCERAVELVSVALEQSLNSEEEQLVDAFSDVPELPPGGTLLVKFNRGAGIEVLPSDGLAYYPVLEHLPEPPSETFLSIEAIEFGQGDISEAVARYRQISSTEDPILRAGAILRIARALRNNGHIEEALEQYGQLTEVDSIAFGGVPISLLAYRSRCLLLEDSGRERELKREAQAMAEGLAGGRWELDRASYDHYLSLARSWLGQSWEINTEAVAMSAATEWLWGQWRDAGTLTSAGRHFYRFADEPVFLIWSRSEEQLAARLFSASYQQEKWVLAALSGVAGMPVKIALLDDAGNPVFGPAPAETSPQVLRAASITGLPWTVAAYAGPEDGADLFRTRRQLLFGGLAALITLVLAGSFLVGRSISRELAVARLQSDFVSAVSHEFRTPLTSLQQSTELLIDNPNLSGKDRTDFYLSQERATRRLRRLVESLLDFGRMESGRRPYRSESLDLAGLVRSVVEEFQNENSFRDFTVECRTGDQPVLVNGDAEALSWALWNLLDNAVKYSGSSRRVEVAVTLENGRSVIRVRDFGIGIDPKDQKRIFRKFERGEAAVREGVAGTGIGLAMVEHVVRAHDGEVRLESEPGKGSTFSLVLPAGD